MKIRQRKLVGILATIAFLAVYALIAMAIGGQYVVGHGWAIELAAFILLGVGVDTGCDGSYPLDVAARR